MTDRLKRILTWVLLFASVVLIGAFLFVSNRLARQLEAEERAKIETWAEAYRKLIMADANADMSLELKVIEGNTTIPVFLTTPDGTLIDSNNLTIPADTSRFIASKIKRLTATDNYFEISISDRYKQYLYYDESVLLKELHYYPYIQLLVILVFAFLFYYMIVSRKQYEQNRVWVGLSKETAHQLGTPIQSLMGWTEYLKSMESDVTDQQLAEIVSEIDKDVSRLHTVADRFSKIGSEPKLTPDDVGQVIRSVVEYMQKRVSKHITITASLPSEPVIRPLSRPLFAWVIENLCKNAVDAMTEGKGTITITLIPPADNDRRVAVEVADNGKGIPKAMFKTIFEPGYTTKTRGWGLGLTLVKRIVGQYHHGKIAVKSSTLGKGTVFRIEL